MMVGEHSALRRERHMAPQASSTRDSTPVACQVVRSLTLRGKAFPARWPGGCLGYCESRSSPPNCEMREPTPPPRSLALRGKAAPVRWSGGCLLYFECGSWGGVCLFLGLPRHGPVLRPRSRCHASAWGARFVTRLIPLLNGWRIGLNPWIWGC